MLRKTAFLLITISIFLLTGCYDNHETDTLATVMAVGVDMTDGGKSYTFAVADTGVFSGESGGDEASVVCFTQSGDSIGEAADILDGKLSKKLSFSHISAVIFSVSAGEAGMYDEVSYFEKKASVRPQTMIALTEHKAEDYLSSLNPSLETNPEKYFRSIFQKSKFYVPSLRLCDFTNGYRTGTPFLAPVISGDIGAEKLTEEEAFVTGSALITRGRVTARIEESWLAGLFLSEKNVIYDSAVLRSVKAPKISVNVNSQIPVVNARLFIVSEGKTDKSKLEEDIENLLTQYAKDSLDVIGVTAAAKKSFFLERSYDEYNISELIKKASFNVEAEVTYDGI